MKKTKFDILFKQIITESGLTDAWERIQAEKYPEKYPHLVEKFKAEAEERRKKQEEEYRNNPVNFPVEGQDKVIEEFNEAVAAAKKAISYPWLKEPYEGIYKELSKYNKDLRRYKNDKQLLFQVGWAITHVLGPSPYAPQVIKEKKNKVSRSDLSRI
jgi:sugar-specific transcriptional regulator TrmB